MAVFLSRLSTVLLLLSFFFFFITTTSPLPCQIHPFSCDSSTILWIDPPFYTDQPGCNGTYLIRCNHESKAMIEFKDHLFTVKNISYQEKTITVEDEQFTTEYPNLACSFLYNFTHPIPHFDGSYSSIVDGSIYDCQWGKESFARLDRNYRYSVCRDFRFYYNCTEWGKDVPEGVLLSPTCKALKPPGFELKLNFSAPADGERPSMSLLSAGFSHNLELHSECFNATDCKVKKSHRKEIAIIASCVGGGLVLIACGFFFWYKRRKRLHRSGLSNLLTQSTSSKFSSMNDPELAESNYRTHIFSYEELQEATNGFDTSGELGDGGFGTVYKGKLRDGRTVAVKRLYENNYRRLEQFMNEVDILSRLRHQHLVTLYGCTSRRSRELLLVYEFVANGTIADHLHGTHASSGPPLLWRDRMSIAIETADALAYLHAVEPPIIHRDVKSTNILLDNNFHVKVADFGLSRLFPLDATHVSTAPQGTPGYVDPEYHQCYQLTDKSDVYSFGVVLVELISSKPAVDISRSRHEINLANMAVNMIQKCQLEKLVDPELGYDSDLEVKRMITQVAELAFTCLQSDRDLRPSIKEVLEELIGIKNGGGSGYVVAADHQVQTKEETRALKVASLASPDSVAERWQSTLTTPGNSG